MDIESLIKIDLDQMSEMNLYQTSQEVKEEPLDNIEKPLEAMNPENIRKRKKCDTLGQSKPFKSSKEIDKIDSPVVKLEKEVKLELKKQPLDIKGEIDDHVQTEEPLNNKVEYLYSYDDPKTWKPCGKCSICQKALGQEDTLKTNKAFMKEKRLNARQQNDN